MEYSEAEKQMLREVLPGIAVQLRGALANIHGALGRLAPERLRDRDTGTDRSAAILCQSYYKILRVVNNLSDAPMLAEDKPLDTENVELVELLDGLCRQGQVLAELLDLKLSFTCRGRRGRWPYPSPHGPPPEFPGQPGRPGPWPPRSWAADSPPGGCRCRGAGHRR